jgi:hypothetical protein
MMKKYNVEGNIDFFAELYKSLDDDEPNNKTDEDKNKCLITNETLTDKFVELNCGHKFNYLPLYNDVLNHKKKFNNMEGSATRLKHNEVRCPYCRKKQTGLMPYYEELNLPKVSGVNYIDTNYDPDLDAVPLSSYYKKCEYLTPITNFNSNSPNVTEVYDTDVHIIIEGSKYQKCHLYGTQLNHIHGYGNNFGDNYGDEKYYCWTHKKLVINNYKKAKINKIKEEKKQAKQKEKEDLQNAKKEAKQIAKDEKQKAKDELKKSSNKKAKTVTIMPVDETSENIIIGVSFVAQAEPVAKSILLCQEILQSGKNKGSQCGNKISDNNLCRRHTIIAKNNNLGVPNLKL